jgi:hypothetical protein
MMAPDHIDLRRVGDLEPHQVVAHLTPPGRVSPTSQPKSVPTWSEIP